MRQAISAALLLLTVSGAAFAQTAPAVTVGNAWSRATSARAQTGGVYLSLTAIGAADNVIGASTPVAEQAELHSTMNDNGVMKMLPVPVLTVEPGKPMVMTPGTVHIMLMGMKQQLRRGEHFPLTLTFKNAPPATVSVVVEGPGASGPAMDHGSMNHDASKPR